jgi:hypothetical protein
MGSPRRAAFARAAWMIVPAVGFLASGCSSRVPDTGVTGAEALSAPIPLTVALEDARKAGLSCNEGLVIAGAIAIAESSLIPDNYATNPPTPGCPDGSTDRGIWQINSCYQASYSLTCVEDPACNATAMVAISDHGTNWEPWGSYNSGRYKQFLSASETAFHQVCASSGAPTAPPTPPPPPPAIHDAGSAAADAGSDTGASEGDATASQDAGGSQDDAGDI